MHEMSLVDYWLEIEGVEGESHDHSLSGLIQLESWGWGEENKGSFNINSGGGSGKIQMSDFKFTMMFNKASPKLFVMCATGEHIPSAKLICRKAGSGQQEFIHVSFTNLLISSFETTGDPSKVLPRNDVRFNFETIQIDYMEQGSDGSVGATTTAGYDLKKNVKL
jgi:type VI secretion system secreted protein Hcp